MPELYLSVADIYRVLQTGAQLIEGEGNKCPQGKRGWPLQESKVVIVCVERKSIVSGKSAFVDEVHDNLYSDAILTFTPS